MDWRIKLILLFVSMDMSLTTGQMGDISSGSGDIPPIPIIPVCPYITFNETISPVNQLAREQFPSAEVQAATRIPIEGNEFSSVFVGYNGVFSLSNRFLFWQPTLFPSIRTDIRNSIAFAPFWNNIDIRLEGQIRYQSFDINNPLAQPVLNQVNTFINMSQNVSFTGTWMLVMEWKGVHPSPHSERAQYDTASQQILDRNNTFQAKIITDGFTTFVIYTYKCGDLNWDNFEYPTTIGYNILGDRFINHPSSGIRQAIAGILDCTNRNQGSDFVNIIYSFVNTNVPGATCRRLYLNDLSLPNLSLFGSLPCPCSLFQAIFDRRYRFFIRQLDNNVHICATNRFIRRLNGVQRNSVCCYEFGFIFGSLIIGGPFTSSLTRYNPWSRIFSERTNYNSFDRDFQSECCVLSNQCNLFYSRRPIRDCTGYFPPFWGWGWGDPHITTLDDQTYTFNGLGEYVLIRSGDLEIQARTETASSNTTATVYSAIAATIDPNKAEVIQVNNNNTNLQILYNGTDITSTLANINDTMEYDTVELERATNDTIIASFSNGVSLNITIQVGVLSFVAQLPEEFRNTTSGLYGNFDGDRTNDYIYRNGTMLSANTSDRVLHTFGQSWQVTVEESLFTYPPGLGVADFSNPNHIPVFLDEIDTTQSAEVCGNNVQCIFDFNQTGNMQLAQSTQQIQMENENNQQINNNFPPVIEAANTYTVTLNEQSVYTLNITDPGDTFNVSIVGELPTGYTFANTSESIWILTISLTSVAGFNFTVVATDSMNASSFTSPQVQICGCENGGNCTITGVANPSSNPVILLCQCPEAYSGSFCDDDADGCIEISCFNNSQCNDIPAPGVGGQCPSCPSGYAGDGQSCRDIDECANQTTNVCSDRCVNTVGSFMCACSSGYQLASNQRTCIDIDECATFRDNCDQTCTNTNGSFICSCRDGFDLQVDNSSCEVNPNSTCDDPNECEQLCVQINATEICSCNSGFILADDMANCTDVNECNSTHPCTQQCVNTVGSFNCTCYSGFTLESDGYTCTDIDECLMAARSGQMICNSTEVCVNTLGGFMCVCPSGTILNVNGTCATEPSTTLTPTPTETPTVPQIAFENRMVLTVNGTLSFGSERLARFMNVTASIINQHCETSNCVEVSLSKREIENTLFKRQSTIIVQQSDIIIINITSVGSDSRVIFYVQTSSGGVLSAINLLAAVNQGISDGTYLRAGFIVSDVPTVTPPPTVLPPLSDGAIAGIVIGGVAFLILIILLLVLLIYLIYLRCCKTGRYAFVEKGGVIKDDDFTVENVYYEPQAPSPDAGSVHSMKLTFAGYDESSGDEDDKGDTGDKEKTETHPLEEKPAVDTEETHL